MATRKVAILMFDDVEVLDFAGPFEVFSVTSELSKGDSLRDSFASRDLGGGGESTTLGLTHGGPETGFFSESVGPNASFRKKTRFLWSECVQESK